MDVWQHASLILSQALGLNGDGVGLNYHYGSVQTGIQRINLQNGHQIHGSKKNSWLTKTDVTYPNSVWRLHAYSPVLYDIDVIGYENRTTKASPV